MNVTEFASLFYWYIEDYHEVGEGKWSIGENYHFCAPRYLKKNVVVSRYLNNGYDEAVCKPAFSLLIFYESSRTGRIMLPTRSSLLTAPRGVTYRKVNTLFRLI
jgi:hypothetical protein